MPVPRKSLLQSNALEEASVFYAVTFSCNSSFSVNPSRVIPSRIVSGSEYEKFSRIVFFPPPVAWNAAPGTKATLRCKRHLQHVGRIHVLGQNAP